MEDLQRTLSSMQRTAEDIIAEVNSLPESCIHWKPGPGVWTVMDNLCHIAEFVPFWTAQIKQVIEYSDQPWGRTHNDPDRLAAVANTSSREVSGLEDRIRIAVTESVAILGELTPEQFATEAPSRNPRWGTKPASFILDTLLLSHLRGHLNQIRRNHEEFKQKFAER